MAMSSRLPDFSPLNGFGDPSHGVPTVMNRFTRARCPGISRYARDTRPPLLCPTRSTPSASGCISNANRTYSRNASAAFWLSNRQSYGNTNRFGDGACPRPGFPPNRNRSRTCGPAADTPVPWNLYSTNPISPVR